MFDIGTLWKLFRKHFTARDVLFIGALILIYLATRIINLDKFPIFTDEGIYIHWAKIAWKDANWRFISLTDGKQPLHTWGMIPFLKLFSPNLLLGGRMFSVLAGFVAMTGIYACTHYLWGRKTAIITTALYVITPMFLFYDRMALADSAVNAGAVWIFFLSILLVRTMRLDVALGYGLVAGLALLTKSSSQMFLGLSALAPILKFDKSVRKNVSRTFNYFILFVLTCVIAFTIYNIQRLSPYLNFVAEKNATFVMTFAEFKAHPFSQIAGNLPLIPWYVASEMGIVLALIGLVGVFLLMKKHTRLALYFLIWIIAPYIAIALFAKVIFPRYLIFFASLLIMTAAYTLSVCKKVVAKWILVALIVLSVGYFDFTIIAQYGSIPFPAVDRGQYIESLNAGWGVKDIVAYLHQPMDKPVLLLEEGNFGVIGDMIEASLPVGDPLELHPYWPLNKEDLLANQKNLATHDVFVLFSHRTEFPADWPIELVKKYDKPGGHDPYFLYRLTK
jgi:4-amino-4-deoxy-L-arabinose transferase-like glycosyltransferase